MTPASMFSGYFSAQKSCVFRAGKHIAPAAGGAPGTAVDRRRRANVLCTVKQWMGERTDRRDVAAAA